jgi:PTS system N-acetylgalactosamine-specific IIA component
VSCLKANSFLLSEKVAEPSILRSLGYIDFPEEATTPQLESTMRKAIEAIDSSEGIIFLTDLLGGTPFRTASLISQERDDIEVVTGTNLQMVAEMRQKANQSTTVEEDGI